MLTKKVWLMIPVLDWNEFESDQDRFVAALGKACRDTGFVLLKNHTVPEILLTQVFEKGDQFLRCLTRTRRRSLF